MFRTLTYMSLSLLVFTHVSSGSQKLVEFRSAIESESLVQMDNTKFSAMTDKFKERYKAVVYPLIDGLFSVENTLYTRPYDESLNQFMNHEIQIKASVLSDLLKSLKSDDPKNPISPIQERRIQEQNFMKHAANELRSAAQEELSIAQQEIEYPNTRYKIASEIRPHATLAFKTSLFFAAITGAGYFCWPYARDLLINKGASEPVMSTALFAASLSGLFTAFGSLSFARDSIRFFSYMRKPQSFMDLRNRILNQRIACFNVIDPRVDNAAN